MQERAMMVAADPVGAEPPNARCVQDLAREVEELRSSLLRHEKIEKSLEEDKRSIATQYAAQMARLKREYEMAMEDLVLLHLRNLQRERRRVMRQCEWRYQSLVSELQRRIAELSAVVERRPPAEAGMARGMSDASIEGGVRFGAPELVGAERVGNAQTCSSDSDVRDCFGDGISELGSVASLEWLAEGGGEPGPSPVATSDSDVSVSEPVEPKQSARLPCPVPRLSASDFTDALRICDSGRRSSRSSAQGCVRATLSHGGLGGRMMNKARVDPVPMQGGRPWQGAAVIGLFLATMWGLFCYRST